MTFSKQLFSFLFHFLFLFPLQDALNSMNCSSYSFAALMCGPLEVPIRFPFCDNEGWINLHCNHLNKTVLELPMSGTFLVRDIEYRNQQIFIADPENCILKRLLTLNLSGSPFYQPSLNSVEYTFLTCPKEEVYLPRLYPPVPCLSNSTSSFFVVSNYDFAKPLLSRCEIVQRLPIPDNNRPFGYSYTGNESLLLKWDSPNCKSCEMNDLRCGFKTNYSLDVKCFGPAQLSSGVVALIISMSILVVLIVTIYIVLRICKCSQRSLDAQIGHNEAIAAETASETRVRTGLNQSTIDSYKKVELGESKRLSGTNGNVCPICLSEYASKEILRVIPECDHCFHMECIDPWLKTHGSCPLCRDSHT